MTAHMEGKVEGYGLVRLTHNYQHISNVGNNEGAGVEGAESPSDRCPKTGKAR